MRHSTSVRRTTVSLRDVLVEWERALSWDSVRRCAAHLDHLSFLSLNIKTDSLAS